MCAPVQLHTYNTIAQWFLINAKMPSFLLLPLTLASCLFNLTTHSTRTMMMNRVRINMTARMADAAMAALEVSCLPAEAAPCVPPTHSWDMGSREGDGDRDGDVLVDAMQTKDLQETYVVTVR